MRIVWQRGKFLREDEFLILPLDRGFCHGLSVFETVLAVRGKAHLLGRHLERMRGALDEWGVSGVNTDEDHIEEIIAELLQRNGFLGCLAKVRISVSLGSGRLDELEAGDSWMCIVADEVVMQNEGLSVGIQGGDFPMRPAKIGNYAANIAARARARREGFDDCLLVRDGGELIGGAMANLFLIRGSGVFTPHLASGCLPGITRRLMIDSLRGDGVEVGEEWMNLADLTDADGAFLTSAIQGPLWIKQVNSRVFEKSRLFLEIREKWCESVGL